MSATIEKGFDTLLTQKEVANKIKSSEITVFRLRKRKNDPLPHLIIGGSPRFVLDEVLQWAKRQRPLTQKQIDQAVDAAILSHK